MNVGRTFSPIHERYHLSQSVELKRKYPYLIHFKNMDMKCASSRRYMRHRFLVHLGGASMAELRSLSSDWSFASFLLRSWS